ncbi:MAG TPA: glycosyltransferase [Blastocatellia bacterium]|nr:glycosyltransferase [Blastocatellia bacterium]
MSYSPRTSPPRIPLVSAPAATIAKATPRPRVHGKFIFIGDEKFYIRGVTYGTFRADQQGNEYHTPDIVERDFAQMAAAGMNAVRTYTVPPVWLLDLAWRYGLRVMVGLAWEQHVAFLEKARVHSIEARVREGVRACAKHPAVLCYVVGNEIPASIVRWYGRRRIAAFIERLYRAAKREDPEALVTYVNYPSTEYLQLPFIDFVCFNVYIESAARLEAYLARLQNLSDDRPLVMAEIGLDSYRHGKRAQAGALDWQVRAAFAAGCAGVFVFAWTDEWHRGGHDITDWHFGLTDHYRRPKPALASVSRAFREAPFQQAADWPRLSVVVCSYNGARTIGDCLRALDRLDYPNYEVIVVDDGSTDDTAMIARRHRVRLMRTENCGLSSARNTGLAAATGEIIAYIDDDAYPDPHWLNYLAATFASTTHAGVGGPNLAPAGDGLIASCVAHSPGGPIHVLLSDRIAEHIPGCNMAFRKRCLEAIGGFDTQFRVAGDDVDVCWRLQERGWTLGFSAAAVVWHHRRNSVRAYWRQQQGYGKAEALLERKWPEKYNAAGHLTWAGRLYGQGIAYTLGWRRARIYQGTWGSALFQTAENRAPGLLWSLTMMPEWSLVIAGLMLIALFGWLWWPLQLALPLLVFAAAAPLGRALISATRICTARIARTRSVSPSVLGLTTLLHLMQPLARLLGRWRYGLTPWRRRAKHGFSLPWPRHRTIWSESWQTPAGRLRSLEAVLQAQDVVVMRGGDYDRWDLEVRGGNLGATRLRMAIEEHGGGKQLARFRLWPKLPKAGLTLAALTAAVAAGAALDGALAPAMVFGAATLLLGLRMFFESGAAMWSALEPLRAPETTVTLHAVDLATGRRRARATAIGLAPVEMSSDAPARQGD